MRLITWNCQGAFRKKAQYLNALQPTLAVIQECEAPTKLRFREAIRLPDDFLWQGDNPDKGVGIFAYGDLRLTLDPAYEPAFRHCIPVRISGACELNLLAIWAMGHKQKARSYVGQVYYAVQHYANFIRERPTILIGDFNSNAIWDHERTISNHSAVVKALAEANIASAYHTYFDETHGREKQNTYFHYRSPHRGYHLDYCFVPSAWLPRLQAVTVGPFTPWCAYSDHTPLMIGIAEENG
ncbi:MAG: hypothetical protein U0350_08915 [Caldilineaceae bacterium]